MGKKVRSARGEMIDFDLLLIKQQLASVPAIQDVNARQDFIDRKLRRRLRKLRTDISKPPVRADADIAPKMPAPADAPASGFIDAVPVEQSPRIKQKARKIEDKKDGNPESNT
jgi:hypothetical protein